MRFLTLLKMALYLYFIISVGLVTILDIRGGPHPLWASIGDILGLMWALYILLHGMWGSSNEEK